MRRKLLKVDGRRDNQLQMGSSVAAACRNCLSWTHWLSPFCQPGKAMPLGSVFLCLSVSSSSGPAVNCSTSPGLTSDFDSNDLIWVMLQEDGNSIHEQSISECEAVTLLHCLSTEKEMCATVKQLVQSHWARENGDFHRSSVPENSGRWKTALTVFNSS